MSDACETHRHADGSDAVDPHDPVILRFYQASSAHVDASRDRMDATTNWASATTAVMVTFCFGSIDSPHFVLLLANVFSSVYLIMESRRYQMYDLWRRRIIDVNHYVVAPVMQGRMVEDAEGIKDGLAALGASLGSLQPRVNLLQAIGYRIRRNYGFLFLVATMAWLLKLDIHPKSATNVQQIIDRAAIGVVPGPVVFSAVGVIALIVILLAALAPTERMEDWEPLPSPLSRWWRG